MTFTVGSIVGPASAGMLIGHDLPHVWVGCVVGGTALAAVAVPAASGATSPTPRTGCPDRETGFALA